MYVRDLLRLAGSSGASLSAARVERKAFCLSVGASAPVVHSEGLSSWDVMMGERERLGGGLKEEWLWV